MEADEALLVPLRELGVPEAAARRALALTGNVSAEAAAQLYFGGLETQEQADGGGCYKMVFVVNTELAMGVGKCEEGCSSRIKHCPPDGFASIGFEPGAANILGAGCRENTGSSWILHCPCHYRRRRNSESGDWEAEAVELRAAPKPIIVRCT
ncbi:uncharacterized protein LOC128840242 isoform X2 [Malaclemys terrapin pileata]|uniref:uncharacterized protein LOC128840242 isoform X2 n=1 Tax=Malaclemys terrapin pileata TaxID=2991368 RepID=UPI0023A83F1F|nr:uncharacterized protein LOC128840242 isoform X2 [Malaclemys terrapin pileata]